MLGWMEADDSVCDGLCTPASQVLQAEVCCPPSWAGGSAGQLPFVQPPLEFDLGASWPQFFSCE